MRTRASAPCTWAIRCACRSRRMKTGATAGPFPSGAPPRPPPQSGGGASMTKAELRTDVFRRLAEADPSRHVFWTVADVDTAIDETYAELADQTECYERAITIDLLSGRPYYDLRTVVPEAVLSIGPAYNETTNRWLIGSSVRDLDGADRRWERVTGTPQRTFLRGLHWLGLYPRVTPAVGASRA